MEHSTALTGKLLSISTVIFFAIILFTVHLSCDSITSGTKESREKGALSGRVLTSDNNTGIHGATVRISDRGSFQTEVMSDNSGNFSFPELDGGVYIVTVVLPMGFEIQDGYQQYIEVDGNTQINIYADPVRNRTATIAAGSIDTLATSSGSFIQIDASNSNITMDVTIEELDKPATDVQTRPVRISVRPQGQPKRTSGNYGVENFDMALPLLVTLNIWKIFDHAPGNTTFTFNVGSAEEPVLMFNDASSTTYRDPNTGIEHTVPLQTLEVPADVDFEAEVWAALREDECRLDSRRLEPVSSNQSEGQPVILVHGWQPTKNNCSDFADFNPLEEVFGSLLNYLQEDPEINDNFKFYTYTYPTNAPVLTASFDLYDRILSDNLKDPIIIGHSMGGLVGRGLLATYGSDHIGGLITLGTPHEGSPMADARWLIDQMTTASFCSSMPTYCFMSRSGFSLIQSTPGAKDLMTVSSFINNLRTVEANSHDVFTLGGLLNSYSETSSSFYKIGMYLFNENDTPSDGIVAVESAVPSWSTLQTVLNGHDHSNIAKTREVAEQIKPILKVINESLTPPSRPAQNDFIMSGSVARETGRTVRVTLNAISIGGAIATDLNEDNFMVIENKRIRGINNFATDNVGVDVVFIQDLSSSMGNAIAGVRSSVITFSEHLYNRGINARFASLGYSGPGTIPTTPPTSPCEFLGPFHDLTDAGSIQRHVADNWVATGGCDLPENGLEAIQYAHENVSWRDGAARVYIDITDVSHHTAYTNCNGLGPCTDQTLESIVAMVGETSTIHVVAPSDERHRTAQGGLDPWKLADATGGKKMVLPSNGYVDLTDIGITEAVGESVTFTFESASPQSAIHSLRIRAEIDGYVSELTPSLIRYKMIDQSLTSGK